MNDKIKEKKLGKYLFISEMRQKNIISFMNQSKDYSKKDIDSLFDTSQSKEASIHYLLGVLVSQSILKLGKKDLIELAKNESEFRSELAKSKNQKIQSILEKFNISNENIIESNISYNPSSFNIYRYIRLMIDKKDIELLDILKNKKLI